MKKNQLLALLVFVYSCKTEPQTVVPNRPPNSFNIITTLKEDGKTVLLNWTKAKDPDGDMVSYSIILKDTLAKNIIDTTFTINNLDYNFKHGGKIIAKDSKGLQVESSFTAVTKIVDFVEILDPNFEKYLIDNKIDKDGIVNGKMDSRDGIGVSRIDVFSRNIKNLAGIEAFTDLKTLVCDNNRLSSIVLNKNIELEYFSCYNNQISILDIQKNSKIKFLNCGANQLQSLDISKNILLEELWCSYNQLNNLDLSANIALQKLTCLYNNLVTLSFDNHKNLEIISCDQNKLTSINVTNVLNLKWLSCQNNKLLNIDLSKNQKIQHLFCNKNSLQVIDINKNIDLRWLECNNNLLFDLDISKNLVLEVLNCSDNYIKNICVYDINKVKSSWQKDSYASYTKCK